MTIEVDLTNDENDIASPSERNLDSNPNNNLNPIQSLAQPQIIDKKSIGSNKKRKLLANIHENRILDLKRRRLEGQTKETISQNSNDNEESDTSNVWKRPSMKSQIEEWRHQKHMKYRRDRFNKSPNGNFMTLQLLKENEKVKRAEEFAWKAKKNNNLLGKLVLKKSNEYRKKRQLPELQWDDELAYIGYEHSYNMAFKGHPFNHNGFNERCNKSRFSSMAENLAMNNLSDDDSISSTAVNGWIASPGHHRNLIGNYSYCGIGISRAPNGCVYITQLFGN